MLSKIGSYRQAIPPGVSLEHLRKPSIKPSPESESIFIPGKPEFEIVPMDVDVGYIQLDSGTMLENWRATWRNSRTPWEDSGTRLPVSDRVISVDAMETDEPALGVRPVPIWAQPIMAYLVEGSLPGEEVSARQDRKSVV